MTRLTLLPILLVGFALTPAALALAHPGHEHQTMGTVSIVHENHIEVKATDGKMLMFTTNGKTRILRGNARVSADAIKVGERVVVMAVETKDKDGQALMVANEVRLAVAAQAPPQPKR